MNRPYGPLGRRETMEEIKITKRQEEIKNMISISELKNLLEDKCPYYYLDNPEYILK